MALFLGIDGGATKTTCAVGDESRVLALVTGGGCNIVRHGEDHARQSLSPIIVKACAEAGVDPKSVDRSCIGAAGASISEVKDVLRRIVNESVSGPVSVVTDSEIALEAALGQGPGVIVASGTGSIAFGRNDSGSTARAGGHGHAVSDEGSGYWIGKAAISAALSAYDRGEQPALLNQLALAWGGNDRNDLVRLANANPAPDFATLFPVVSQAGAQSDPLAAAVLRSAGEKLAELAATVIRTLWSSETSINVGVVGSVFKYSEIVIQEFSRALVRLDRRAQVSQSISEPVLGALSLARRGRTHE